MNFDNDQPTNSGRASLPATMAGLLETAICDSRKLNKLFYYPHFEEWHQGHSHTLSSFCEVCLAGSVIARTLQVSAEDSISPSSFDKRTHHLLLALDDMRNGDWLYAFLRIYSQMPSDALEEKLQHIPIPDCIEFSGWKQFEAHLASLETLLPELRQIDGIWKESQSSSLPAPASGSPLPAMRRRAESSQPFAPGGFPALRHR